MRNLFLIALIGSVASFGCQKSSSSTTTTTAGDSTSQTSQASKDASFDRQFIDMMVPHHEQGIMMAKMAEDRAEHPELKTMARKMIDDQQKDITEMKSLRKQWFTSDATPPADKMSMVPGMEGQPKMDPNSMHTQLANAKPFDKTFIDMMIEHHKTAIRASELDEQKGSHPELKQLAKKTADQQKKEVAEFESLRSKWYGAK